MAAKLAVRPSSRPNSSATTRRATCVDTKRSVVAWNVPTFSACEWRSAAEDALGANGSWTCTKSSSARSSSSSSVRDTSSGSDTDPPRRNGSDCPTASTDAQPGLVEERVGVRRQLLDLRATLAHQLARVRRRDDDYAVAANAECVGKPLDEAVDLVVLLPRPRGDLGDRERLAGHPAQHTRASWASLAQ